MGRKDKVLNEVENFIEEGNKPTVKSISQVLGLPVYDVHRCINILEKEKTVFTYSKKVMGEKRRFVGLIRN